MNGERTVIERKRNGHTFAIVLESLDDRSLLRARAAACNFLLDEDLRAVGYDETEVELFLSAIDALEWGDTRPRFTFPQPEDT